MIERIEIFVTELPVRVRRIFSSGSYDTGPREQQLGKPVLVKIHADGVVGCAQIRPISPGHFVADTTHSVVAAISEIYAPGLLGKDPFDIENITEGFDARFHALDIGEPQSIEAFAAWLNEACGRIDGLVNNAAIATGIGGKTFEDIDIETWDRVMRINVRGTWLMIRALLRSRIQNS